MLEEMELDSNKKSRINNYSKKPFLPESLKTQKEFARTCATLNTDTYGTLPNDQGMTENMYISNQQTNQGDYQGKVSTKKKEKNNTLTFVKNLLSNKMPKSNVGSKGTSNNFTNSNGNNNLYNRKSNERFANTDNNFYTKINPNYNSNNNNFLTDFTRSNKRLTPKDSFDEESLNRNSRYNDYQNILNKIDEDILTPIKNERERRRNNYNDLNSEVDRFQSDVNDISFQLNNTQRLNNMLSRSSNLNNLNLNRTQLENYAMEREIEKIKNEANNNINKLNKLEKEKVIYQNAIDNLVNEIDNDQNEIKLLTKKCEELINEKKILTSALLLVRKKNDEKKMQIKLQKSKENICSNSIQELYETFKVNKDEFDN